MTAAAAAQPAPQQHRKPNLPNAIRELRDAIDRLIKPSPSYLNNTYIEAPGLYRQLHAALDSYRDNAASSVARSRPPMWIEAAEQLNNIDLMINIWDTGSAGSTVAQLRSMANKNWTPEDVKEIRRKAGIINAWADDIQTLLNHEHTRHLTAACPACGTETIQHRDSAGELVRSPALQLTIETGCTCQACGYHWAPNQFVELATDLGIPSPEGVVG